MKILYVTTISLTVNCFLVPHIKALKQAGHDVDIACNSDRLPIAPELLAAGCRVFHLPFQRSLLSADNFAAYRQIGELVRRQKYDVVHTHTPVASACVRWACRRLSGVRVFYTAHGFHFLKGGPLLNWLLYYPVERWLARYTDLLITINQEDFARASRSFPARRVAYLPGVGMDLESFAQDTHDRDLKRSSLGLPAEALMLLSVGELNANKDQATVIRAMARLADPRLHYLICGDGTRHAELLALVKSLGLGERVRLLGYCDDVRELLAAADLFVLPSRREGLPVALMEAMAAGLPVVCTAIRGNVDLIQDAQGGRLVGPGDVVGFAKAIGTLVDSPAERTAAGHFNRQAVQSFDLAEVTRELLRLYEGK